MIKPAEELLRQPLQSVAELTAEDIPGGPGIYAWYRLGRLFYVGESHRGLRSRLWGNHVRGNARGSTLRNKVAKAHGFPPTGFRAYGRDAEQSISAKLFECDVRFLVVTPALIDEAQVDLIRRLDPPMNDHPGLVPRWRLDEVREILAITPRPTTAPTPPAKDTTLMSTELVESQRVTLTDIPARANPVPSRNEALLPEQTVRSPGGTPGRAAPCTLRSANRP